MYFFIHILKAGRNGGSLLAETLPRGEVMRTRMFRLVLLIFLLTLPVSTVHAEFAVGAAAPGFETTDLEGHAVRLSDYKGHPFILKLATTWCPSCKQQSAELAKAGDFLSENKIPVIEVFVDDTEEDVRQYTQQHPRAEPHVTILDDGSVYKAYNVYLIPRLLVIDGNFKVKRDGSVIEASELKPILQKLLK